MGENKIINALKKSNTWAAKCKLEYFFGISSDNDPRNGADSGECIGNEQFISNEK